MKALKIIFSLLITSLLTACVGQERLNIDELLKKYNSISGSELKSSMFAVSKSGNDFVYKKAENGALLCLYAAEDGEIIQCTVTVKNGNEKTFEPLCVSITEAFTGFSDEKSRNLFKNPGVSGKIKLTVNDYELGKTMILNKSDNELNTNAMPTLKREIDEKDIARPTLPNTTEQTTVT